MLCLILMVDNSRFYIVLFEYKLPSYTYHCPIVLLQNDLEKSITQFVLDDDDDDFLDPAILTQSKQIKESSSSQPIPIGVSSQFYFLSFSIRFIHKYYHIVMLDGLCYIVCHIENMCTGPF